MHKVSYELKAFAERHYISIGFTASNKVSRFVSSSIKFSARAPKEEALCRVQYKAPLVVCRTYVGYRIPFTCGESTWVRREGVLTRV